MPIQLLPPHQFPHSYGYKELTGNSIQTSFDLAASADWIVGQRPWLPVLGSKSYSLQGNLKPDNGGNATLQFAVNLANISNPSTPVLAAGPTLLVQTDPIAGAATGYYGFMLNLFSDREGYFGLYTRGSSNASPVYETTFSFQYGSAVGLKLTVSNLVGSQSVNFGNLFLNLS